MKKLFLLLLLACLVSLAHAQTTSSIPNGNFEQWSTTTINYPLYYPYTSSTDNYGDGYHAPNVTQSTDVHSGSYAVQLSTLLSGTDTIMAYVFNTNPQNGNPSSWHGGVPYIQIPTGISGYYKYNTLADSGTILVAFSKKGVNIGTYAYEIGGIKNTYTPFNFTLIPALTQTPDSVIFGAISCKITEAENNKGGSPGSTLLLDDISFTGVTSQPADLNGGFESWGSQSQISLDGWYSQNGGDKGTSPVTRTTDKENGTYAIELTTYLGSNQNNQPKAQAAEISTGYYTCPKNCNSNCNCIEHGGYPYTKTKDTLAFWYKYAPAHPSDSAQIQINFKKNGNQFDGRGINNLQAAPTYTYYEIPFDISNDSYVPDSVVIDIQSVNWNDTLLSYVGGVLKIDGLHFKSQVNASDSILSIASNAISFTEYAGNNSINITGTVTWTATTTQSWLTVSQNVSSGNGVITLTAQANTGAKRTATVTVSGGGLPNKTITVTQDAFVANLAISSTSAVITASVNSSSTITVTSNIAWTAISGEGWLTVSPASGTGNGTLTLTATANTTSSARTATVILTGTGVSNQTITVIQSAPNCTSLKITPAITNDSCNGESNGAISVIISGGTAPYKYKWSTTGSDSLITDMPKGTYSVTATDSMGCTVSNSYTITQPQPITITPTNTAPSCTTANGSISVAASGGNGNYTYVWNTGNTSQTLPNVAAGLYSLTITDANKCTQVEHISLSNANGPIATVSSVIATQCNVNLGSITVSVTGGSSPYSYKWNDGVITSNRTSVSPGNYSLSVSDANGCIAAIDTIVPATTFPMPSISLVTVDSASGKNMVVWLRDATNAIDRYNIYRETTVAGKYAKVGSLGYNLASVFVDSSANPQLSSWRYKLSAVDFCGNEMLSPNVYKTMYLQQNLGLNGAINLDWTSYEGSVYSTFDIYRKTKSNGVTSFTSVSTDINSYTDPTPPADIEAYIVAIDLPATIDPTTTKADTGPFSQSLSNMAESQLTGTSLIKTNVGVLVYPNPAGKTFTVAIKGDNANSYSVELINSLGQVVYKTTTGVISRTTISIDATSLAFGVYTLRVSNNEGVTTQKVIIAKQ